MSIILILTWFSTGNGHHIHHDVDEILGYHDTPAGPWEESPSTIPRQAANGGWITVSKQYKGKCHRDNTSGLCSNTWSIKGEISGGDLRITTSTESRGIGDQW